MASKATARIPAFAAIVMVTMIGCVRKDYPVRAAVVSSVELEGAKRVDPGPVLDGLATTRSSRFLGIWDGVIFDYEVFEETVLEGDLVRIQRYYRSRGYYEAHVTAARIIELDEHRVRVQIHVEEGEPVRVAGEVQMPGVEQLPADVAAAIRAHRLRAGAIFDEDAYERTKIEIIKELGDSGYAFAKVNARADVDMARHTAVVVIEVNAGKRARYGPISIVGLEQLPERPFRANLELVEGAEYSRSEIEDARNALVNLGVVASIDITQDLSHPDSGIVPITVAVRESPFRTIRIGGGLRFDVYELSSNLNFGWEHRNFLGGMRKFTIDIRPGVVFYPTRIDNFELPTSFLLRNFVRVQLRQPAFIEGRTTGFVGGEFNVYPVLYPGHDPDPAENLLGYMEVKGRAGVERAFFGHHLYLVPSVNFQFNAPFAYNGDNPLDTAYVSYPQLLSILDFRDDPIETRKGTLVSNTIQVAGLFGGGASDVKIQPEIRGYIPISKSLTLATRATVGFLFPFNYGSTLSEETVFDPTDPAVLRDEQLLLLRAFFSGGPTSNRGYPVRGVGPQGILGFLLPNAGAACTDVNNPDCLRALGGLTLWETSVEMRIRFGGAVGMGIFIDASDVSRETANIRLNYPHLSTGVGFRYTTPIGPIRLDLGYRVPYAQKIGQKDLPETEGIQNTIFGAPIAVHFALGEAY